MTAADDGLPDNVRELRPPKEPERWLSVAEVASRLRIHVETVRRWIKRGQLPAIKLGYARAGYRISDRVLERFLAEHRWPVD